MTTKTQLLEVIRKNCIICCGGSWLDVENCTSGPDTCALWKYRMGVDPEGPSEARQEAGKKLAMRNKAKVNVQL